MYFFNLNTSYHLAGLHILARWFVGTWKWSPATYRCKVVLRYAVVNSNCWEYGIAELCVCIGVNDLKFSPGVLLRFLKLPLEIKILPWDVFPFHSDVGKAVFPFSYCQITLFFEGPFVFLRVCVYILYM